MFFRFDFEKAYRSGVLAKNIVETDPYYLLKRSKVKFFFGEYQSCYEDLKQAASKAQANNQFHLYFICFYNIKLTEFRIKSLYSPEQIEEDVKKIIIEDIENISLPSIIEKLFVNKISKEILHSITSEELYHNTYKEIKTNLEKIKNLYKSHKNGASFFSGPNYIYNLIYSYRIYHNFILKNHLFDIFYGDFSSLTDLFSEGLFISLATDESLKQKLTFVQEYDIENILKYSNPKNLYRNLNKYLIGDNLNLPIEEKGIKRVFDIINSFIGSNIEVSNFFHESIRVNYQLEYAMNRDSVVSSRFRRIFDNFLIILSKSFKQFKEIQEFKNLIEDILRYITASKNAPFSEKVYFKELILICVKLNDKALIDRLLHVILKDRHWSDRYFENFAHSIDMLGLDYKIDDEKLVKKIFIRTSDRREYKIKPKSVFPILKLIDNKLTHLVKEFLEENFEEEKIFVDLAFHGYKVRNLTKMIEEKVLDMVQSNESVRNHGKFYSISKREFYFVIAVIIKNHIKFSKKVEEEILKHKNIYAWLLTPEKFDYSFFDIKWLYAIDHSNNILEYLGELNIDDLENIIHSELKNNYSNEISSIYWKYFS